MALLLALYQLKRVHGGRGELAVAHFNHGLRPEADADEAWLQDICVQLSLPFVTGRGDVHVLAAEQGDGIEAAARSARLAFLKKSAGERGARFVVTAHTADDQVETVLFRVLRGTGIAGLAGIHRVRALSEATSLIRPMLSICREEVVVYLHALNQDWRDDASNRETVHTRNRIRHELLPLLRRKFNPQVDNALLRLARQAGATDELIQDAVDETKKRCVHIECVHIENVESTANEKQRVVVQIDAGRLSLECGLLIAEVCRATWREAGWPEQAMTESHWLRLVDLVCECSAPSREHLPNGILAEREKDKLILTAESSGSVQE